MSHLHLCKHAFTFDSDLKLPVVVTSVFPLKICQFNWCNLWDMVLWGLCVTSWSKQSLAIVLLWGISFQWVIYSQYSKSIFTGLVRFHPHHTHCKPLSNNEFKDISSETWPACCSSTKVRIFVLPSLVTWEMAWYSSPDQFTGCE